jgi:hypothetical protein
MAIPGECAINPERGTDSAAAIGALEKRKRFEKIAFAGSGAGKSREVTG